MLYQAKKAKYVPLNCPNLPRLRFFFCLVYEWNLQITFHSAECRWPSYWWKDIWTIFKKVHWFSCYKIINICKSGKTSLFMLTTIIPSLSYEVNLSLASTKINDWPGQVWRTATPWVNGLLPMLNIQRQVLKPGYKQPKWPSEWLALVMTLILSLPGWTLLVNLRINMTHNAVTL